MRECRCCGLLNPDTASRCDCGYSLDEYPPGDDRGQIIRRSVALYWDNFRPLAFLGGLFWVPAFAGTALPYIEERHYLVLWGLVYAATIMASTFVSSMSLIRAASLLMMGREVSLSIVLGEVGWRSFFRFVWTGLVGVLAAALGMLPFVVPGLVLALRFALAGVIAVLEETGGSRALARSWTLLRGRTLEVLRVWGLLLLPNLAASTLSHALGASGRWGILGNLIELLVGTFWSPVWWIAMTVLYRDAVTEERAAPSRPFPEAA